MFNVQRSRFMRGEEIAVSIREKSSFGVKSGGIPDTSKEASAGGWGRVSGPELAVAGPPLCEGCNGFGSGAATEEPSSFDSTRPAPPAARPATAAAPLRRTKFRRLTAMPSGEGHG